MRIGYYAHHHGSGHCRQADKLAALLPTEWRQQLTVFTSLAPDAYNFTTITDAQIVRLSAEDERLDDVLAGRAGQYWQPSCLHYSPVGNHDIQTRSWQILDTIQQRQIDLMIIDVSVEVAMLCRVASVPYLYVRLAGIRDDIPHSAAFAGALALLAPYPQVLDAAMTPDWVRQKTFYLDFLPSSHNEASTYLAFIQMLKTKTTDEVALARLQNALPWLEQNSSANDMNQSTESISAKSANRAKLRIITVIKGYGGHEAIDAKLPALRLALPKAFIISLGPIDEDKRAYVDMAAHVSDVTPFIAHSDWLLMACGLNGIAQVYNYDTPLVVLPDSRPHQEQEVMAEALIDQGRAVSWEHFVRQIAEGKEEGRLSAYSDNNYASNGNNDNENSHNLHSPAQDFMSSLATYTSPKLWFQEWLLPKMKILPEI